MTNGAQGGDQGGAPPAGAPPQGQSAGSPPKPAGGEAKNVVLSQDQYFAVLDALNELDDLKAKITSGELKGGKKDDIDSLADEGRGTGRERQPGQEGKARSLEDLSKTELVQMILGQVEANVAQPLLTKLEGIRLDREIEKITEKADSEGKTGEDHEFWTLREEVYKIASENPNLSLARAYKMARAEAGEKPKKKEGENTGRGDTLRTLPKRDVFTGEKPGFSQKGMDEKEPETRGEATSRAIEDMRKKGIKI